MEPVTFDFGTAMTKMSDGKLVSRLGWNGPGQFAFMRPEDNIPVSIVVDTIKSLPFLVKKFFMVKRHSIETVKFSAYFCLKAKDNSITNGWVPSQTDMLATDWYEFNVEVTTPGSVGPKELEFRKKPVTIQAIRYTNFNREEINAFVGQELKTELESETAYVAGMGAPQFSLIIPTMEGPHKAMPGDYIICGVKGEYYPCKPDIFDMTYEKV